MKRTSLFLLISFLLFYTSSILAEKSGSQEMTGRKIMLMVDKRPDGNDRTTTMKMTLINKRGKKKNRLSVIYAKDYGKDLKSIFLFKKPTDVKGVAFLSWSFDAPEKEDENIHI